MHSRLFQIDSKREEPKGFGYYSDFLENRVDYFGESKYRPDDLNWLEEVIGSEYVRVEKDTITILKSTEEVIVEDLTEIKSSTEKLTISDLRDYSIELYRLKNKMGLNYWFTMMIDFDGEIISLKQFVWQLSRFEVGTKLHIGTILDFHN